MKFIKQLHPRFWVSFRMLVIGATVFALFTVVLVRAYRLQFESGPRLRELAEQQYLKEIQLPTRRGSIVDRHGAPLAASVEVPSVYANPRQIGSQANQVSVILSDLLDIDVEKTTKRLSAERYYAWVKRRISAEQAQAVKSLNIPGIFLTSEHQRFYPNRQLASTLIGFTGADSEGLSGIEMIYDEWLRGSPVRVKGLRDALGRNVLSEGFDERSTEDMAGHDVVLAIDKFIQFETEQAVQEAYANVDQNVGWVSVVVMDPQTGDVLAMADAPGFDPNHYHQSRVEDRRARAITDTFEPGSTIKVFTAAVALEAGVVKTNESFHAENGNWRVGRHIIHDSSPHGQLTFQEVLQKSSNIAISKIAFRLGKESLYQGFKAFGFGEKTGAGLIGERSGILRSPKSWSQVGLANISFGQGMTATVLQMTRAMGAIANRGMMMTPRMALGIRNARGQMVKEFAPKGERVMNPQVANTLRTMLISVTEQGGTARGAATEHYTVGGKTGTAQKVDPVTGGYSNKHWVASFVGYAPATDPRIVVSVVVNEPKGLRYHGGDVAAPIFKRVASNTLKYLRVKPDKEPGSPTIAAVGNKGTSTESSADEAALDETEPSTENVLPPELPGTNSRIVQHVRQHEVTVPDFTGMSITEVIRVASKMKLRLELRGSGVAVSQSPGPGSRSDLCKIDLRPPG